MVYLSLQHAPPGGDQSTKGNIWPTTRGTPTPAAAEGGGEALALLLPGGLALLMPGPQTPPAAGAGLAAVANVARIAMAGSSGAAAGG